MNPIEHLPYYRKLTSQNMKANGFNTKKVNVTGPKYLNRQIKLSRIEEGLFMYTLIFYKHKAYKHT